VCTNAPHLKTRVEKRQCETASRTKKKTIRESLKTPLRKFCQSNENRVEEGAGELQTERKIKDTAS